MVARRWVMAGVVLSGCFDPSPEALGRLEAAKGEAREMGESLDNVEGRLLLSRSMVAHWNEMASRHREVSAIACTNQSEHAVEMVALLEKQQTKARRQRRPAVAAKFKGVGGPAPKQTRRR